MSSDEGPDSAPHTRVAKKAKWRKRIWHFLVTFAILNGVSLLIGHESREKLKGWNDSFVESIEAIDPFRLGKMYWNFVLYNDNSFQYEGKPDWMSRYASEPRSSFSSVSSFVTMLGRAVSGVIVVISHGCSTGGPVSIIVTILALALAVFVVTDGFMELDVVRWILIPFVGAAFVFVLLALMWVVGWIFGEFLVAAQMIAAIEGTVLGMFWKVGEHHALDKMIGRATGHR